MNKNHKTLDVDQLFVRNIIFKDFSNRPISSNQYLTSRGDGGTYFSDASTTTSRAFVEVRAENISIPATTTSNILYLGAGAGIQYYSTAIDGGINTKLYITATAPEQISVIGDKTLNFSTLRDDPAGGRTLYYAGTGDTTVNVSDTTILFGSVYNSSYGSLQSTISTTESLLAEQSTLVGDLVSTLVTVDGFLLSTNLSTFYSLTADINQLSTFVWSSFTGSNHSVLNITTVNAQDIHTDSLTTNTLQAGHTLFSDSNYQSDSNSDTFCSAIVSTGTVSTIANFLVLSDDVTGVKLGFDKERLYSYSTQNGSTFQTLGNMYQLGLFAQLSTQGGPPFNPKNQFKPVIEQIEVVEQIVTSTFIGSNWVSSIQNTNYALRTVGKFDEICSAGDKLVMNGNVSISSLFVSSVNGGQGYGINSTVSTFYVSSLFAKNANMSSVYISTGHILNGSISTANVFFMAFGQATGNNLSVNTISSGHIGTGSMIAGDLYAFHGAFDSVSTNAVSTCDLSFCQATGIGIRTEYISTGFLSVGSSEISSLSLCELTFCHASGDSLSTLMVSTGSLVAENGDICELRFCHGIGSSMSTFVTSTGQLMFGEGTFLTATGSNLSTNNLSTALLRFENGSFATATGSNLSTNNLSTSALRFDNGSFVTATGSNLSTNNLSTSALRFGDGSFVTATGSNLSTNNLSTSFLRFGNGSFVTATGSNLSTSALQFDNGSFVTATGSNLSTNNLSTALLRFENGSFATATGSNLSTNNLSTSFLRFGNGSFVTATGSNLSTNNLSTSALRFGDGSFVTATGSNLSTNNLSTSALRFDNGTFVTATGSNLSTNNLSTSALRFGDGSFVTATGSNLSTNNLSTSALRFGDGSFVTATGSNLSTNNLSTSALRFGDGSFMTATGSNLSTNNLSTSALRFGDGSFVTATGSNLSTFFTSTGNLRFGNGSASNLEILSISSGSLTFRVAQGETISTTYISATQMLNSSLYSIYANISTIENSSIFTNYSHTNLAEGSTAKISSIYTDNLSAGHAHIGELDVNCISANCISTGMLQWGDAYGSTMNVLDGNISTLRLSTVMGFTEPIFTFDMANRRVGVNLGPTQQPRATMDVRGIVYANNFVTTSDRRLKHSIRPISDESVYDIPQAYRYVNEDGDADIGVMADEIEQIAPECVYLRPDGYKAVSYTKLVPVCLTLIRSLATRLARLEAAAAVAEERN